MADEAQDIFGKIDALLERRAGFSGLEDRAADAPDFPTLTEIVAEGEPDPLLAERRHAERRGNERRAVVERRQAERRRDAADPSRAARAPFTDEQFDRFMDRFEQKLEDLFIRQQLRTEESIRQAVRDELARLRSETD